MERILLRGTKHMAAMESSSAEQLWWTELDDAAWYQFEPAVYGSTSSSLLSWSYILEKDLLDGDQLANEMEKSPEQTKKEIKDLNKAKKMAAADPSVSDHCSPIPESVESLREESPEWRKKEIKKMIKHLKKAKKRAKKITKDINEIEAQIQELKEGEKMAAVKETRRPQWRSRLVSVLRSLFCCCKTNEAE
ncbi:uncharacterized protein PF3D7_1120000-like isoform X4 [Dendropsophus ebraccatus]|uniref:uncharacterized protein PF3D7_1120000-like isoform X4 n=1 Tax=Dendropsophus ebraccatus TaxID=150705 RepID=UPI0038317F69